MEIIEFIIFIFCILVLYHVINGPTIWDRILSYNIFSALMVLLILVASEIYHLTFLEDVAIVYTLLGFVGVVLISRFVQKKGKL